ncbi:hypothetical protein RAHE111665_09830 [Rariglobus hedericola]
MERTASSILEILGGTQQIDSLTLAHLFASMTEVMRLAYSEYGADKALLDPVSEFHKASLEAFLSECSPQAIPACKAIKDVMFFMQTLCLHNTSIYVIDLPVGNTLFTKLLFRLLEDGGFKVKSVRAALSRNDRKTVGITRAEVLVDNLLSAQPQPNDVFIYIDEWVTGSNFNSICEVVKKGIPKECFFLPVALLADKAYKHPRFESFKRDHDKIIKNWGVNGAMFRVDIPPLNTLTQMEAYFFWADQDRLAGVRKMQVHGSLFSSIEESTMRLSFDREALTIAANLVADRIRKKSEHIDVAFLISRYPECYQDFMDCKDALRECVNEEELVKRTNSFESELRAVIDEYSKIIDKRPAKLAIELGMAYSMHHGSLDPSDRYYFKNHAARVEDLSGEMAVTHQIAFGFLWDLLNKSGPN